MRTTGAGTSSSAEDRGRRRSRSLWRVVLLLAMAGAATQMQSSVGAAPTPARPAQVAGGSFQTRICQALRSAQADAGDVDRVRQALRPWLTRFGCPGGQPPGTTIPSTTTTTSHIDCPLPGGGVGPCPTTTTSTVPPTTLPPGVTTVPPPSTTLPPCPSTTTVPTTFPNTTIPCQP